jgi:ethanolamine ammonia-lyase large subunit
MIVLNRRRLLAYAAAATTTLQLGDPSRAETPRGDGAGAEPKPGEDLFAYIDRTRSGFDQGTYLALLGAANPFKEGDASQGLAAPDEATRQHARQLIAATTLSQLLAHPIFPDPVVTFADSAVDGPASARVAALTFGDLKTALLERPEDEVYALLPGLSSDVIGVVVKLMSNDELVRLGARLFHPLPGSRVGARGYLGARVQPNSPTDHPDDIQWQVFDAFAYGVGDVLLGTNPVSSEVAQVARVERVLQDLLKTFGLTDILPHCVLAHVDVQEAVERADPGATALWFQSLAGVADGNKVFDISVEKMRAHCAKRSGAYGMYFETGQGADETNGQGKGFDMVIKESRKYGFARALGQDMTAARAASGKVGPAWMHVNDVAGFIGPEVFRTREQLVRVCLEDTVMGKLHGLTIGLDVCSTLHMEVSLDDLDWCLDQIAPANPGYLMALPTKNDPMLSYLTTAFQDHVRLRSKFGFKVEDRMWSFFQRLGTIGADGGPGPHFGDPGAVYLAYRRAKGDNRDDAALREEARKKMAEVRARGVFLAEGHGANPHELAPALDAEVRRLYADSKQCIFSELPQGFPSRFERAVAVNTRSPDRAHYILHPPLGEALSEAADREINTLRDQQRGAYNAQIVISDGLNALALTDEGHLEPYLAELRRALAEAGLRAAPETVIVTRGRVRVGYRIGERLFGNLTDSARRAALIHIIGERPGNGHHTFSVYLTYPQVSAWARGGVDHDITRVIAGIADTALAPRQAAAETVEILRGMPG